MGLVVTTDRMHLKAVVAIWLATDRKGVHGANAPREFAANDWFGAREATENLVEAGLLKWATPDPDRDGAYVVPTAAGIFEALS